MVHNPKYAQLFIVNFREAYRNAKLLVTSLERLSELMPLKNVKLDELSDDDKDKLDAFRVRYSDLQDTLGAKVFRGILILEDEQIESQLDLINKIEKRRIIESYESWKSLRDIRNVFSHEYPEGEDERREALNEAYKTSQTLIDVINNVKKYVSDKLDIVMDEFENLRQLRR